MRPPSRSQNQPVPFARVLPLVALLLLDPIYSAAHVEDRIVAVVNSDLIMLSEVQREIEPERARLSRQHRGNDLAQRLKMAESMALTRMIERRLQLQEAKAKKIEVSDQEVKQAVEQLRLQGEAVEPSNPLDLRRVRDELVLRKVVDLAVRNSITVGDAEMKRYYEAHRDRFVLPDEYTLSQIFIQPRAPDEVAEALAKAREAMNELKHGEKFEEVAARYSDGPNALQGGRLGVVRQGELLPAVERAIASLVPGGVSDIIESPEGFHIIRLEEKSPRQFRPFDEVQFEIQALIFQQKSEDVFQAWLGGLKKKAHIEIKF
jgi:parvulin-like peptidyl-prolyl isomerase